MRRLRRVFVSLLLLFVALVVAGYVYLSTGLATARVASRLEAVYGGRVALNDAVIGLGGSALRGLQLYEVGPDAPSEPWASASDLDAALTLWDVISGDTVPDDLTLRGAVVTLRFDRKGDLLTRLPPRKASAEKVGTIRLRGGQVTIRQEGRPDLVVTNIDADLKPNGNRLELAGTVEKVPWGQWDVRASWDRTTNTTELNLKTTGASFTKEQLAELPFVSDSVWRHVKIDGTATVDLTLRHTDKTHTHIALDISEASLFIPSIDLKTDKTSGRVVIDDRVVTLTGVSGRSAEGDIRTEGTLDFQNPVDVLKFKVLVKGVQVKGLPSAWLQGSADSRRLAGRISAKADLEVEIRNGAPQTRIHGDVTLDASAVTLSFTLEKPGEGFRVKGFKFSLGGISRAPAEAENVWSAHLTLPETDLRQVCQVFGLASEAMAGRIEGNVVLTVPIEHLSEPKTYRLRGSVRLPWLRLSGVEVRDVAAQLDYHEGALQIEELHGRISSRGPPGCGPPQDADFTGNARLELFPLQNLTAQLCSTPLPLAHLLNPLLENNAISGTVGGSVSLTAPLRRLGDVTAWHGTGRLTSDAVGFGTWTGRQATADLKLSEGRCTASNVCVLVEDTELRGGGSIAVAAPFRYSASLEVRDTGPALLKKLAGGELPWQGRWNAKAEVSGDLQPFTLNVGGTVTTPELRVGDTGLRVDQVEGSITYCGDGADYHLRGGILGGRLDLDGRLAAPTFRPAGRLRILGAAVSRLGQFAALRNRLGELRGEADLDVAYHDEDGALSAEGALVVNRLRWGETELSESMQADVVVQDGAVRLRNLSGDLANGLLRGQASYSFRRAGLGSFEVALDNADAARLLAAWPGTAERVEGSMDLRLRGQLGPEWRGGGSVSVTRGTVAGVDVGDWRLPFNFGFLPAEGRGEIEVHETSAQVARGRAVGRLSLTWGVSPRLEGQVRFYGLDLRALLRSSADAGPLSAGQLSGRLDFGAASLRSSNDLTATLDASLQQAQALELPILRQLVPYIAPGQSAALFQAGDVRARLANGIVRIERLRLVSPFVQLIAEGSAALSGPLTLEVTANVGRLAEDLPTLRGLGGRLPAVGALSLALVTEASNFLANRLVHLHVAGTVNSPVIHVEPITLLPEEVVRFFLSWAGSGARGIGGTIP